MKIRLSETEYKLAMYAGQCIHEESERAGLRDRPIVPGTSMRINQVGQLGEMVVAKALDLYWGGSAWTLRGPDLSHDIEVRTIKPIGTSLKVRIEDDDAKRVVGVRLPEDLEHGEYEIVGWVRAGQGKKIGSLIDPYQMGRPYYAVPVGTLLEFPLLKCLVEWERTHGNSGFAWNP